MKLREVAPREKEEAKLNGFYMEFLKEGKPEHIAVRLAQEKFATEASDSMFGEQAKRR